MRISDWSSDVCSTDLDTEDHPSPPRPRHGRSFATDMDRAARLATVDTTHARDHASPSGSGTGIHARSAGKRASARADGAIRRAAVRNKHARCLPRTGPAAEIGSDSGTDGGGKAWQSP